MAHTVVRYVDGMQFIGHGNSGHAVVMDGAEKVGGSDSAARPLEVLLCALGGCSGMDVVSILGKMRTPPSRFSIEIDDERAPDYPKAITKLHLVYRISGDVPEENVKKAIELSLSKYCPVANSLAGVAEITSEYVLE